MPTVQSSASGISAKLSMWNDNQNSPMSLSSELSSSIICSVTRLVPNGASIVAFQVVEWQWRIS
jgi:hypothetical protein